MQLDFLKSSVAYSYFDYYFLEKDYNTTDPGLASTLASSTVGYSYSIELINLFLNF